jgi:hypothetical protein
MVYIQGEDSVKGYLFGKRAFEHKFCPTCGSSLFVDAKGDDVDVMALNVTGSVFSQIPARDHADGIKVRMVKDIDLDKLKYWKFGGKTKLHPP